MTDPLGHKTDYAYDSCGNVTSVKRAAGTQQEATTTFTYQIGATCVAAANLLTTITDPLNHVTTLGYDGSGKLTSITDPLTNQNGNDQ